MCGPPYLAAKLPHYFWAGPASSVFFHFTRDIITPQRDAQHLIAGPSDVAPTAVQRLLVALPVLTTLAPKYTISAGRRCPTNRFGVTAVLPGN